MHPGEFWIATDMHVHTIQIIKNKGWKKKNLASIQVANNSTWGQYMSYAKESSALQHYVLLRGEENIIS